ncbi:MAG: hypothetical protein EOO61_05460 [Hymenobacter sp.]|nr:MAG: hypothetical protein EOO61_05460 [Hymenobacter sp.]
MRLALFTYLLACLSSIAKAQDKSFVLAPLIGLDQISPNRTPVVSTGIAQNVAVVYKPGVLYGLEGSYSIRRVLLSGQLTTTNRIYEATGLYRGNANLPVRVSVQGRYFSLPLTISYLVKSRGPVQIYAGIGLIPELISSRFKPTSYDILGSGISVHLEPQKPSKPFALGSLVHIRGRYMLNSQFLIQLQGEFRYFTKIQNPFITTDNSSFSLAASIGYRLF